MDARLGVEVEELRHLVGRSLREVYARELCGRLPTTRAVGVPAPTIAYASGLAGLLLAAEVVKTANAQLEAGLLRNYIQVSASAPESAWVTFREKQDDCPLMCASHALQAVVDGLWMVR